MITAGIDCGAKNTKTVILKDGKIIGKGMVLTGFDSTKAVEDSLDMAVKQAGLARRDIQRIFGTGSGKNAVKIANDSVNDI
jgi:benzoyl-CoA reductase subunit D